MENKFDANFKQIALTPCTYSGQMYQENLKLSFTLRISKGFLVSAGMMAPISDTGNRGSSIVPSVCGREGKRKGINTIKIRGKNNGGNI